ncbi:hypothetical protein Y032_0282g1266 [Ancylostoma ceylanicum]|uniref:Ubiquitin carboxyl-terminal hydrolase 36 n=1 Tax=Ancylostoma ceylanicum TaxID=53326 RepID=A0A016S6E6_9BILA|nr:hypothetical protein Y032_0282g1266 [Ancylostoma ceylanicum]
MMSTVDISSMLCEKILEAKIFFPKLLVTMANNTDEAMAKCNGSDVELPFLSGDEDAICELIMEEDTADDECQYPEMNASKTTGDDCGDATGASKSRSSSLCVSPGTADSSSFLSDALDELDELELEISPSRKVSLSDAKPNPNDSGNSSQSDTLVDLPAFTSPVKEDFRASQSYDENSHENGNDPTTSVTEGGAGTTTKLRRSSIGSPVDLEPERDDEEVEQLAKQMSKWRSLPQLEKSKQPIVVVSRAEVPKNDEKKKERSRSVGGPIAPRVRKLSEKGKIEQRFPVFDPDLKDIWDFKDFNVIKNIKRASGISNGGQHCFMISVMQILTHTASFIRFIVEKHNHTTGGPVGRCFCCDLRKHLLRVLSTNVGSLNKMDWIFVYWKSMFGTDYYTTQEDAHEFLLKILDLIDRCSYPSSSSSDRIPKEPSPPMTQLFGFKLRYQLTCLLCGLCSVSYALHNDLSLHLPRGGRYNVPPRMHDLIAMYMKSEVLEYACPDKKCNGKLARRTPFIFRAPSVLILQVKRFFHTEKKNGMRVQVEEHLSLKDFTYSQSDGDDYELTGIISHEGHQITSGHYTALVRGFDRQFYLFNDEYVRPQKLLTANLCPYLIIYSRKGPQDRVFAPAKSSDAAITNTKPLLPQRTNSVISAKPLLPQRTNTGTSPCKDASGTGVTAALPKSPVLTKTVLPRKPKLFRDGFFTAGSELGRMRISKEDKWFYKPSTAGSDLEKRGSENESQKTDGDAKSGFDVVFGSEDEKGDSNAKENEFTSSMDTQSMGFGVSKLTQAVFPEASSNENGTADSTAQARQMNPEQLLSAINTFVAKESRRRGSLKPSHLLKGNGCYNCVLCNSMSPNNDSSKWKKRRLN